MRVDQEVLDALEERGVGWLWSTDTEYDLVGAMYEEGTTRTPGIYVDILNEAGYRTMGANFSVLNGGEALGVIEKGPDEEYGGNVPIFAAGHGYTLRFEQWRIGGMGLGTRAEPNVGHHVAYGFVFKRKGVATPKPAPTGNVWG